MLRRMRIPGPMLAVLVALPLLGPGAGATLAGPTPEARQGSTGDDAARGLPCPSLPDRSQFVDTIDNPYLPLLPGSVYRYRGTEDGEEQTNVVEVTRDTKTILGVETTVVLDVVRDAKGDLVEKTLDWYAQDKGGNVWYFGEASADYKNGQVVSTKGSWEAGVDNAEPGIVMEAKPRAGDRYRQECAPRVALDTAEVLSLDESVRVPAGSFRNVLQTKDYTPLEPNVIEEKYYARCIGNVRTEKVKGGQAESVLVDVKGGLAKSDPRCRR